MPPPNIEVPAESELPEKLTTDPSLPHLFVEPHNFCFDAVDALPVTIFVVNRSPDKVQIVWRTIENALHLKSHGSGMVAPIQRDADEGQSTEIAPMGFAKKQIDLRALFTVPAGSVYSLQYRRKLTDLRFHVSGTVQFLVEDGKAIDRLLTDTFPEDTPTRDTTARLLKANPFFAVGTQSKTYGWDAMSWTTDEDMRQVAWTKKLDHANSAWKDSLAHIRQKASLEDDVRARAVILDRLLALSNNLACPSDPTRALYYSLVGIDDRWSREDQIRLHLKLGRCNSSWHAALSLNRLSSLNSTEAIGLLVSIAGGSDSELAECALSSMSNYSYNAEIDAELKKLMTHRDPERALHAAIITCYSGDWSGFPLLLEGTKSPNRAIAMKAIGQLVDSRYQGRANQVVPLLLPHLATKDMALLERTIETLGNYRIAATHVLPFLKHENKNILLRTILALNSMGASEAITPLIDLKNTTTDETTLKLLDDTMRRLKKLE